MRAGEKRYLEELIEAKRAVALTRGEEALFRLDLDAERGRTAPAPELRRRHAGTDGQLRAVVAHDHVTHGSQPLVLSVSCMKFRIE